MTVFRMYTGDDGQSHLEKMGGDCAFIAELRPTEGLRLNEFPPLASAGLGIRRHVADGSSWLLDNSNLIFRMEHHRS